MRVTPAFHFKTASAFRAWLEEHHASAEEITVLFYNRDSGKGGLTYAEAVDAALCFGWIDGLVRRVDATSHTRRFTPRRARSIWSLVNVRHAERLIAAGQMSAAGRRAFDARTRSGVYSFEQTPPSWPPELVAQFRAASKAWAYWGKQPPGYRRTLTFWVVSAKQAATRQRRLAKLIAACAAGRRVE